MGNQNRKQDPYLLHRTALRPLLPDATPEELAQSCRKVASIGEAEFLNFLHEQGLAAMWDKVLEGSGATAQLSEDFKDSLRTARMHATGHYLIQRNSLTHIKEILDEEGIVHVVYKGADTRERYYVEPALRPAMDIDMLVSESSKVATIKAFERRGFEFHAVEYHISHEANLIKGRTSIDIHWDIMRPGRTHVSMVEELLGTRQDCDSHWGMSHEANLFVMLVHPVFTKYSTTPQAALMRMVDLANALARPDINWHELVRLLEQAGLKTAAWITLRWLRLLTDTRLAEVPMGMLQPGRLRGKYLDYWINGNLASRFLQKPAYVQAGFTLPAHDRLGDALQAVRRARKLKHSQAADLAGLLSNIAAAD